MIDIDAAMLSSASHRWLKAARIVGQVSDHFDEAERGAKLEIIAGRLRELVDAGLLESQGDLSRWRYSEVRLPLKPPN